MLHPAGFRPSAPDSIPVYVNVIGPKGIPVARFLTENLAVGGVAAGAERFDNVSVPVFGSVLDDGEPMNSDRLRAAAAGPALAQTSHLSYELGGEDAGR